MPLSTGNFFLMLRSLFCIAANLTTNELIGRRRYGYMKVWLREGKPTTFSCWGLVHSSIIFCLPMISVLQAADGRCHNRFDRGPVSNCTEFWEQGWPDWGAVYEEDERVRDRENRLLLCNASSINALCAWHKSNSE